MKSLWDHLENQIQQFPDISGSFLFILTISPQILKITMETVLHMKSNLSTLNEDKSSNWNDQIIDTYGEICI